MNQSTKILTVSYGTFSCTLEGFEDSFDTMKAIAEYFRDLAAEDRYFGAEPPTPDADMLARIAEKEVARRVEAHQDAKGIHLRTAAPAAAAALAALPATDTPPPAPAEVVAQEAASADIVEDEASDTEATTEAVIADEPEREGLDAAADAPEPVEDAESAYVLDPISEAAESLSEASDGILDAVADTIADAGDALSDTGDDVTDTVLDITEDATEAAEDLSNDITETGNEALGALEEALDDGGDVVEDAEETVADTLDDADSAADDIADALDEKLPALDLGAISAAVDATAVEPAEDPVTEEDPTPEPVFEEVATASAAPGNLSSVAAKLARIRQVVSTKAAPRDDGFTEDEHADDMGGTAEVETAEDVVPDQPEEVAVTAPEDTIESVLGQLAEQDEDQEQHHDAEPDAEPAPALDTGEPDVTEPAPEPRRPITARVLKVKREALNTAVASGLLEEVTEDEEEASAPQRAASSLSDEDEADLQAALAEVTAELEDTSEEDAALPEPAEDDIPDVPTEPLQLDEPAGSVMDDVVSTDLQEVEAEDSAAGRNVLMERGIGDEGSDVSRLLDKADSEMADPSGRQRRNAISHLRAAVAATRDDDDLKRENDTQTSSEAYRSDLDEVVRPRRPVSTGAPRAERPDQDRPAPLQLVAEQRVDTEEAAAAPVRPRRVTTITALAEGADDDSLEIDADVSFADFAEEMGASALPDLLEAAAAYMSFVEKRPAFSRPQLMTKVRQVEAMDYSREDRLRSFGVLLREGKIEKTDGGQFTASDRISYRPDEDRAAG